MPYYHVSGYEVTLNQCIVEADNESDAVQKAFHGECIEGTQDTEPGENIWRKKWTAEEYERIPWDGKGFGAGGKYRPKA